MGLEEEILATERVQEVDYYLIPRRPMSDDEAHERLCYLIRICGGYDAGEIDANFMAQTMLAERDPNIKMGKDLYTFFHVHRTTVQLHYDAETEDFRDDDNEPRLYIRLLGKKDDLVDVVMMLAGLEPRVEWSPYNKGYERKRYARSEVSKQAPPREPGSAANS
jgi:hypothetical protein